MLRRCVVRRLAYRSMNVTAKDVRAAVRAAWASRVGKTTSMSYTVYGATSVRGRALQNYAST